MMFNIFKRKNRDNDVKVAVLELIQSATLYFKQRTLESQVKTQDALSLLSLLSPIPEDEIPAEGETATDSEGRPIDFTLINPSEAFND